MVIYFHNVKKIKITQYYKKLSIFINLSRVYDGLFFSLLNALPKFINRNSKHFMRIFFFFLKKPIPEYSIVH